MQIRIKKNDSSYLIQLHIFLIFYFFWSQIISLNYNNEELFHITISFLFNIYFSYIIYLLELINDISPNLDDLYEEENSDVTSLYENSLKFDNCHP